jgi:hypothetical protein
VASLPSLPSLPSVRRVRPSRPCACGCGAPTKSTWFPGHDGRATGWAIRVERGVMKLADVPANERRGAEFMLARRAAEVAKVG